MKWIALCLRNKLIVILGIIAMCLLGLFCLYTRPVTLFPAIAGSDIIITINYPGANAQTVQQQITSPISHRLQSLDDLEYTDATSQAGMSHIHLSMSNSDPLFMLKSQLKIIQAINSAHLPNSASQPDIEISGGQSGLISFMGISDVLTPFQMGNFLQANLAPKLNSLPGATEQDNFPLSVVRIKLKPEMLAKYHLSATAVSQTIANNYQSSPLGTLVIKQKDYTLNIGDDYQSLTALGDLLIGYSGKDNSGLPLYVKDIAQISFEPREITPQYYFSYNGHTGVTIGLSTFTQADPLLIAKKAKQYAAELRRHLPADMKLITDFDTSVIMKSSISEVSLTILFASLLVLLVALAFLGHLRTTLIPIVTIPICLLGAMIVTTLFGFSITVISLLAMVIAVGLVVDDAIVVVENITRHIELGHDRKQAVLQGTAEIMKTIIGITLTLLAVYVPIIFISGALGSLLKPFALTLASAVLISGIVSLTLTPIMANALVMQTQRNRYQLWFGRVLNGTISAYQRALKCLLQAPKLTLLLIALLLVIGSYFALQLHKEVFPTDPNGLVGITVNANSGDDIASLKKKILVFKPFFNDRKVRSYRLMVHTEPQTNLLTATALIRYQSQYLKQNQKISDDINAYIKKHAIQNASAQLYSFSNWGGPFDMNFFIYGSDIKQLQAQANLVIKGLKATNNFTVVTSDIAKPEQQLAFTIDQVKAARLGIYRQQIKALLAAYYGGTTLESDFSIAGLSVPIVIQLNKNDLQDPQSIEKLRIQSPLNQKYYALSDFVQLHLIAKPGKVRTFNNMPSVSIFANFSKNIDMAQGIDSVNKVLNTKVPNVQSHFVGGAEDYLQSNNQSLYIAILGILCVYFLLTILYRNLLDPLIIMLTVPFTVIGGALALFLIHGSLNIYSVLGLITLIGLITKHGILIVQFANSELKKGAHVLEAILLATQHRFRPIIMTTLAMVLGALPLLLSSEIMYVSRQSLAIVIMGGLLVGTLFSLFIVPIVYVLMKKVEHVK